MDVGIDNGKIDRAKYLPPAQSYCHACVTPCRSFATRNLDRQLFQSRTHAFERRRFDRFDMLKTVERFGDARAGDDDYAVAIADHHVAGGDRDAAADDREPDRA